MAPCKGSEFSPTVQNQISKTNNSCSEDAHHPDKYDKPCTAPLCGPFFVLHTLLAYTTLKLLTCSLVPFSPVDCQIAELAFK